MRELPVVIISGDEDESARERALALGANGFIPKGSGSVELLATLSSLVSLAKAQSELALSRAALAQQSPVDPGSGLATPAYLEHRGTQAVAEARRRHADIGAMVVEVDQYDELARGWRQLILKKKSSGPAVGTPSLKSRQLFFMACYDIDTFRAFVDSSVFKELFVLPEEEWTRILSDDVNLLQFSFRYLKQVLFGENTIPLNEEIAKERREKHAKRQEELEKEAAEKRAQYEKMMMEEGINEEDSGLGFCEDESCGDKKP